MINTKTLKIGDLFLVPVAFTVTKNDPQEDSIVGRNGAFDAVMRFSRDKVISAQYNIGTGDRVTAENGKPAVVKAANGDDLWLQYDDETYGTSHRSHVSRA